MMTTKHAQQVLLKEKTIVARHEQYLNIIVWLTVLIFIIFASVIYYWSTAYYKLFTFNKVTVEDKIVAPGEALIFNYDYCKETTQSVEVTSILIGTRETYIRPLLKIINGRDVTACLFPLSFSPIESLTPTTFTIHYAPR